LASKNVKEALAQDISQWLAEGWISPEVYETLAARYQVAPFAIARILSYIGITGGIFSLLGVLGLVATMIKSPLVGLVLLMGLAAVAVRQGLRLVRDPLDRYPNTARMLLTIGMLMFGGGLFLLADMLQLHERSALIMVGLLWFPATFALSYVSGNAFLLALAVLLTYHWVGSFTGMWGRAVYTFSIEDPRMMALAAMLGTAVGLWQARQPGIHSQPFARVYQSLGLLYFNMSLLILPWSVEVHDSADFHLQTAYVILGGLAAIGQIVLGARLQSSLFTGFGLTFAGIHLFTRYYEHFWNSLDKGLFFLIGGIVLFGIGTLLEKNLKRIAGGSHAD
jgi:uncharacterized membrane protein